jgi:phosphoribosyl 1,2-cyclic phosphodiesterase
MRVTFWGVRGSIPAPGPSTVGYGGNTTCIEVECGNERIIFDAGTGIRGLGQKIMQSLPMRAHLFFTHTHWDHIQGLPFFAPGYVPGGSLDLYCYRREAIGIEDILSFQMSHPYFPVTLKEFNTDLRFHDIDGVSAIQVGDAMVTPVVLHHPDGVVGYRVDHDGASVVFATDTEHVWDIDPNLRELAQGADLMIHDAQFYREEYEGRAGPSREGWGHSTVDAAVAQAQASSVENLILFHHDPDRDDEAVRDLELYAQSLHPGASAAREGVTIELPFTKD